jgi:DNA-binding MarR family transcriptional regulator
MANDNSTTAGDTTGKRDLAKELIYQIRRLMQAGSLYSRELEKNHQVSAAQLNCLLALYDNGPLPPSQIARWIFVKPSTVTGIIDRLEQKDLVRRSRNSPDRRVITIELTENGLHLCRYAPPPIQQKILDGLKKLPENEVENILGALDQLTKMLDVHDLEVR